MYQQYKKNCDYFSVSGCMYSIFLITFAYILSEHNCNGKKQK